MTTVFIISALGIFSAGFIIGALFSMYLNGDFKEDLSKPNNDYD